jgi:hypothetical protein
MVSHQRPLDFQSNALLLSYLNILTYAICSAIKIRFSIELKLKKSVVVLVWNTPVPNRKAHAANRATQTEPKKCVTENADPANKLSVKTRTAPKYTKV